MAFKDIPDGQTHYQNDGCGMPEHNTPMSNEIEKKVEAFHQWKRLLNEYHLVERGDREGNLAEKWLRQALTDIYALGREEALKEGRNKERALVLSELKKYGITAPSVQALVLNVPQFEAVLEHDHPLRSLRTKGKKV